MFAGLTIAVGSGSAIKLAAVRAAFPEAASVEGYGVPSGVADQPSGAAETEEGALNRARGAREACPGADMWIAFENGMVRVERGDGDGDGDGDGVGEGCGEEGDGERGPHEGQWVDRAAATIITKDNPEMVTTVWSKDLAIPAEAVAACMHDDGSVTVWSELKDPHGEVDPTRPRKVFLCECLQAYRKSVEGDGGE